MVGIFAINEKKVMTEEGHKLDERERERIHETLANLSCTVRTCSKGLTLLTSDAADCALLLLANCPE